MPTYTSGMNHIMMLRCCLHLLIKGKTYRTLKLITSKKRTALHSILYGKRLNESACVKISLCFINKEMKRNLAQSVWLPHIKGYPTILIFTSVSFFLSYCLSS